MSRFRNPRYAPEWLEGRLSPSGVGVDAPTLSVEVTSLDDSDDDPDPTPVPPGDGSPPTDPGTPPPTDPAGPGS